MTTLVPSFMDGSSLYPPQTLFVVGYTVFTLSVRLSVRNIYMKEFGSEKIFFDKMTAVRT